MRVNSLRVIAVALIIVLIYVMFYGFELKPDIAGLLNVAGLSLIFFCSILMTEKAGRFARTAVVVAVMIFLEVVRVFRLTEAESIIFVFGLLYMFLTVLLVITAADAVSQFGQLHGYGHIAGMCDATGHIYAVTFVLTVLSMWFEALSSVFLLINGLITLFAVAMFIYFYNTIYVVVQEQFDPPPEVLEDEEDEEGEEDGEEEEG
jgi:hypothetical protein